MTLTDNKEYITRYNAANSVYWGEDDIRYSDYDIWHKQNIDIHSLITSNDLIDVLYDEINRE
jgi:hypothetical protein